MSTHENTDTEDFFDFEEDLESDLNKVAWDERNSVTEDPESVDQEDTYPKVPGWQVISLIAFGVVTFILSDSQIGNVGLGFLKSVGLASITVLITLFAINKQRYPSATHHFSDVRRAHWESKYEGEDVPLTLSRRHILLCWVMAAVAAFFTIDSLISL